MDKPACTQADRQTGRQADRQTDRQTDRHTQTYLLCGSVVGGVGNWVVGGVEAWGRSETGTWRERRKRRGIRRRETTERTELKAEKFLTIFSIFLNIRRMHGRVFWVEVTTEAGTASLFYRLPRLLTWHLIGWVCRLSRLRRGEARAVAEACLQRRLALGQAAFCLDAWQHHAEVYTKTETFNIIYSISSCKLQVWKLEDKHKFLETLHCGLSSMIKCIFFTLIASQLCNFGFKRSDDVVLIRVKIAPSVLYRLRVYKI